MALKYKYSKAEEIPAALAPNYVGRDGAFVLDVEGVAEVAQVTEARAECERLTKEKAEISQRLHVVLVEGAALSVAATRGLKPTARQDLLARAERDLAVVDGHAVVVDAKGAARLGADGKPMTVEQWADQQVTQAPHLFEGNSGSGTAGTPASGLAQGKAPRQPFERKSYNMSAGGPGRREEAILAAQHDATAALARNRRA